MANNSVVCRQCGQAQNDPVFRLEAMPLAGAFQKPSDPVSSDNYFPISLHACGRCGLVQLEESISPDVLFRNYSFSTNTISSLVTHFSEYADWLITNRNPSTVFEFGCNDGTLLKFLRTKGVKVMGADAANNIVDFARAEGLDVINEYFTVDLADEILKKIGPIDVVTGSNCFAHNPDPIAILDAARSVLSDDGVFIVEVMYAGDLLKKLQWDTLYHEHLTVFSLQSISWLFRSQGWSVVDVVHLPMHAGSIRVVASPKLDQKPSAAVDALLAAEKSMRLNAHQTWVDFGARARRQISLVADVTNALAQKNRLWAYGASGRATMWMNACNMDYIERVVDSSPLRAERVVPKVNIPIVFPDEMRKTPPDYMLITAWNYAAGICAKEYWYQGRWITPLPELKIW